MRLHVFGIGLAIVRPVITKLVVFSNKCKDGGFFQEKRLHIYIYLNVYTMVYDSSQSDRFLIFIFKSDIFKRVSSNIGCKSIEKKENRTINKHCYLLILYNIDKNSL